MAGNIATGDCREKAKQLRKIEHAATSVQLGRPSPLVGLAGLVGLIVGAGLLWAFPGHFLLSGVAVLVVYFVGFKTFALHRSWRDALDNLLTEYEPVNAAAYQRLVDRCRDVQGFDLEAVFEWLQIEREAAGQAVIRTPNNIPRFVRKHAALQGNPPHE